MRTCPHTPIYVHTRTGPRCTHLPVYIPSHTHLYTYPAVHTHVVTHLYTPVYVPTCTQAVFPFAQASENFPEDQGLEITGQLTQPSTMRGPVYILLMVVQPYPNVTREGWRAPPFDAFAYQVLYLWN